MRYQKIMSQKIGLKRLRSITWIRPGEQDHVLHLCEGLLYERGIRLTLHSWRRYNQSK